MDKTWSVSLLATALDPNQVLGVAGTIVVAILALFGVTIGQNRRLKVVDRKTDQLVQNGGATVADGIYATRNEVSQIRETVNQILANQTQGFQQGLAAIQELGAVKQAQSSMETRVADFERHTTDQFATVASRIDQLSLEIARLSHPTGPIPVVPQENPDV